MLALDLGERIAERVQEILVGIEHHAVHAELDHRLRLADRLDLAFEIRVPELLFADIGGELHHLEGLSGIVEDRIVGGEDPDLLAALSEALVFARLEFAAVELRPELAIGVAVALFGRHEHAVMLALDFGERVAERVQESVVGGDDGAVEIEFDHRLRAADGRDLAGVFHAAHLFRGDVAGELDHPARLAAAVENGIVGSLNPDLPAALAEALVFPRLKFAAVEIGPEFAIFGAVPQLRRDEHRVMLALDFLEPITERVEEILVGGDDRPVHLELDHGLRFADCRGLRDSVRRGLTIAPLQHLMTSWK